MSKTIKLSAVVDRANEFMLHTPDDMRAERKALHCFVANFMMGANNYGGFSYLYASDMEKSLGGKTPGIIFDETSARKHTYPDDSRTYLMLKTKD